ncbi:MAG: gamma carbonic anhydrase family protein [Candidatus Thermoplasmatota archaeon]|nr:gamma carbonic anhydrase family protein [Candidatus Thermoplasmatota archaeon]
MGIFSFEERVPSIGDGTFIFETATVVGAVVLGEDVYVGPGAVVRGDYGSIVVGDRTSIEENVVIHARPGEQTVIGNDVTLGHGAVIHNCVIEDLAVIGMGSVVSDYAHVGSWGVVAEGAVVRTKGKVEEETVVAGVPAKPLKKIDEDFKKLWLSFKANYPDLAHRYLKGLKRLDINEP